jgi:hypothetical protein
VEKNILIRPYPFGDLSTSTELSTEVPRFFLELCFLMKSMGIAQQAINSPKINHTRIFSISAFDWLILEFRHVFA